MAPSYLYQAPCGVPGDITRALDSKVEPVMLIANGTPETFPQAYGIPVKYAPGGVAKMIAGDLADSFAGVLVREVPQISGNTNQGFDDTTPNPAQANGLCTQGYINVKCASGTPVRGAAVFVQIIEVLPFTVGTFRADADGLNTGALTLAQASWASDGKDAAGNAELRIAR